MLQFVIGRMSRLKILRRCFGHPYLVLNKWIWRHLPAASTSVRLVHSYGRHCQSLVQMQGTRQMSIGTFFLRNRPELECMRRLLEPMAKGSSLSVAVLACSKGAEVYSISFVLRSARPDLKVTIRAIDISQEIVEFAAEGRYSLKGLGHLSWPDPSLIAEKGELAWRTWQGQDTSVFERMTATEMQALFEREGDQVRVKPQFREGIAWQAGDAGDAALAGRLGLQDIVVANRFLCHMKPTEAEHCLRNAARLVKPGGYIFVSGVDLDVRTKVALDLGWKPVTDLIAEMHNGDPSLTLVWPWNYCGLEPFDRHRADWQTRYASVFQVGGASGNNQH